MRKSHVHPSMTVNVCDIANFSVNEEVSRSFLDGDGDDEVDSEARARAETEIQHSSF